MKFTELYDRLIELKLQQYVGDKDADVVTLILDYGDLTNFTNYKGDCKEDYRESNDSFMRNVVREAHKTVVSLMIEQLKDLGVELNGNKNTLCTSYVNVLYDIYNKSLGVKVTPRQLHICLRKSIEEANEVYNKIIKLHFSE